MTLNELLSVPRDRWAYTKVENVMVKDIVIASPEMEIFELYKKLAEMKQGRAPVIENERLIGFISNTDILRFSEILMIKRI